MSRYIEEKNIPALIIYTVIIAVGIVAGIGSWNSYQTNQKMDYLLSLVNNPTEQQTQQQTQQQPDNFKGLSNDTLTYYNQLGEQVTGTPTWLIDGKKYMGFDYTNNKVPGFDGDILTSNVIMFASPTCGFCEKAEKWLDSLNADYLKVCAPIHAGDLEKCKDDKTFIV